MNFHFLKQSPNWHLLAHSVKEVKQMVEAIRASGSWKDGPLRPLVSHALKPLCVVRTFASLLELSRYPLSSTWSILFWPRPIISLGQVKWHLLLLPNLLGKGPKPRFFCPVPFAPWNKTRFGKSEQKIYSLTKEWRRVSSCSNGTSSTTGTEKEPSVFTGCDAEWLNSFRLA